ncbi:hypothetical protein ACP3W2_26735, partial [Salmonella enterica]|uniref:hypothetical protein n=1 Tax=Salmonella enterica TaxID=28901 RepID=UPI003CF603F5
MVGFSRTRYTDESWRKELAESTAHFVGERFEPAVWERFAARLHYHPGDIGHLDDFHDLARSLAKLEGAEGATRVYY